MKKIILSIILFSCNNLFSQNTINKVTYKVGRYNSNYSNDTHKKNENTPFDVELNILTFHLYYNNEISLFSPVDGLNKNNDFEAKSARIMAGNLCYKNNRTMEKIEQIESFDEIYNVAKPFEEYLWEITSETRKINGYICYKAKTKKRMHNELRQSSSIFTPEAWFCPEIPSTFGPKGLDGLPGLVLEATFNGRIYYYATEIEFDTKDKINLIKPTKYKYVSEEELIKIDAENFRKFNDN